MAGATHSGGCFCGAVRFVVRGDFLTVYACHCTDCQTVTGSAFGLYCLLEASALELTDGEPATLARPNARGETKRVASCATCGTTLWGIPNEAPTIRNLRIGVLDDTTRTTPVAHLFARSKASWIALPDDALIYEAAPPDMLECVRAWQAR